MNTKHLIALAIATLTASALIASAQDNGNDGPPGAGPGGGPGGPGRHHRPPPLPLVTVLDANHDGTIDAAELANATTALLALDKNGDGSLSAEEFLPKPPPDAPADAPKPPLPPLVKAIDANGDGTIDAAELSNAAAALKSLDKNSDGELTRDEFIGKRPGRPPGGGEGHDGPRHRGGPDNDGPPGQN